jgi:hypothetical protein
VLEVRGTDNNYRPGHNQRQHKPTDDNCDNDHGYADNLSVSPPIPER